jgi:hypothetical protein
MTKYAKIASLAAAHSERHFAHKNKCRQVANRILDQFCKYLEAPPNMLQFVELNEELNSSRKLIDQPTLKLGDNDYWYFGLRVHFKDQRYLAFSNSTLKFGLKVAGTSCSVKLDSTTIVDLLDMKALTPVFDDIVRGYENYYSANTTEISQSIGFIQMVQQ